MAKDFYLGIDLGTTNTYASIYRKGDKPRLIALSKGKMQEVFQFPSIVDLETEKGGAEASDELRRCIKRSAKNLNNNKNTEDTELESVQKRFLKEFKVLLKDNKKYAHIHNLTPIKVMTIFIKHLLYRISEAEFSENKPEDWGQDEIGSKLKDLGLKCLTITVPSAWKESMAAEQNKIRNLFLCFGFEERDIKITYEPVAAAISDYMASNHDDAQRYLVIDIGGGTTDFATVLISKNQGHVQGIIEFRDGKSNLGGLDFDREIYTKLIKNKMKYKSDFMGAFIGKELKELGADGSICGISFDEFSNDQIISATEKSLQLFKDALYDYLQENQQKDIHRVLLVGGMSLFDPIREIVESLVKENLNKGVKYSNDPNLNFAAISLGASIIAAQRTEISSLTEKDLVFIAYIKGDNNLIKMQNRIRHKFGYRAVIERNGYPHEYYIPIIKKEEMISSKGMKLSFKSIYGIDLQVTDSVEFEFAFIDYNNSFTTNYYKTIRASEDSQYSKSIEDKSADVEFWLTQEGIIEVKIVEDGKIVHKSVAQLN